VTLGPQKTLSAGNGPDFSLIFLRIAFWGKKQAAKHGRPLQDTLFLSLTVSAPVYALNTMSMIPYFSAPENAYFN